MAGAAAAGTWLALAAEDETLRTLYWGAGGTAVVVLALGLVVRLHFTIPLGVAVLGAEYALLLAVEGGPLDERAPLVAAALFVVADLAYWSLELREAVADEPGIYLRRVGLLALLALGVVVVGMGLLAAAELPGRGSAGVELLGAAAAVAALALLAWAARDSRTS